MIALNATILIQIIHFFIAYSILRFIFFKPLVAILHAQEAQVNMARSRVVAYQADVAQQEEEKIRRWHACQRALAKRMPSVRQESIFQHIAPQLSTGSLTDDTRAQLAQEVANQLIKKVDHVS